MNTTTIENLGQMREGYFDGMVFGSVLCPFNVSLMHRRGKRYQVRREVLR